MKSTGNISGIVCAREKSYELETLSLISSPERAFFFFAILFARVSTRIRSNSAAELWTTLSRTVLMKFADHGFSGPGRQPDAQAFVISATWHVDSAVSCVTRHTRSYIVPPAAVI